MLRRSTLMVLAALLVLVACTDLIGPSGGDSVRLVIQPSFGQIPATAAADDPAARVDNVHVLLRNAGGSVVLDTVIQWPLDQDTLRMELDVVVQETGTYDLTIQGRSGERLLFQAGPMSLELSEDDEGSTVATSPVLEYAGPGAEVVSVEITDAPDSFLAGSTVALGATGANDDGTEPEDLIIVWTSLDADAAMVDDEGRVQVGHDASRAVSVEARVAFTTITDTIGGAVLPAELTVSPDASTLTALGAELTLTTSLLGEDGGNVTGLPIEWSVVDPSVLELIREGDDGGSAAATALTPGTTRVVATAGELVDTADVAVEQTVARVGVDPDSVTLEQVGATVEASATAFDANDNEVEDASVEWSSREQDVATVAEDGTITAVSPGTAWITAASEEAGDSLRVTVLNIAPEVAIAAPSDGATFEEGDVITFEGTAEDLEDGDLSGEIEWVSDNPGELGTGATVSAELEPGDHTITAAVTDADGATESASIEVTVNPNTPPTVSITSPEEAITVSFGTAVTLEGAAADEQDGELSESIEWSSDLDGELGTGASEAVADLSIGSHTITASVSDSRSLTASATREIEVTNNAPVVEITAPEDGATYDEGENTTFEGVADDVEEGDLTDAIQWSSDIDGELGGGASVMAGLSSGTHTITATVTDGHGDTGGAATEVTVRPNTAPVVTIVAPEPGTTVPSGSVIMLEGTAIDEQDGDLSGSIEWSSDLDAELGIGASLVVGDLSIGSHTITASVSDSRELTASATRAVEVTRNAPVVEITAPEDGATYDEGENTTFEGAADDVEDGDLTDAIQWSSDIDGELGGGASVTAGLSSGTHTITATVTDSHGDTGGVAIEVTVRPNTAPVVTIVAPEPGTTAPSGGVITLEGTAIDEQDGDLSEEIEWVSDLDGGLGMGASVMVGALSVGTHEITAVATDVLGETGGSAVSIEIVVAVTGTVFYSTEGLPDVTVELVQGETESGEPLVTTTTDADGAYAFMDVPDGVYWVKAYGPTEAFTSWIARQVTVEGISVTEHLDLPKNLLLQSPADGSGTASQQPVLEWEANAEAVSYTVQINVTDSFELVEQTTGITTNQYTVQTELAVGETYTWQVDAYDDAGHYVGTSERAFSFTAGAYPVSGTVFYGTAGVPDLTMELESRDEVGPPPQATTTATDGSYLFPAVTDGEYLLSVVQTEEFSGIPRAAVITIAGGAVTQNLRLQKELTLESPVDGAEITGQPVLKWQSFPEAANYRIRVTLDSDPQVVVEEATATGTSHTVEAALTPGQVYRWRVDADDDAGNWIGATVQPRTFIAGG